MTRLALAGCTEAEVARILRGGIRNIVCRKADDCICRSRLLKASACAGNPDPSDLKLGLNATVTAVKQAKLDQYHIVYFATHGLVSGDLERFAKSGGHSRTG